MSKESIDSIVKSCIVSRKGGMPLLEIEEEYRKLVGEDIPYASLGYKTLLDFIKAISFVKVRQNFFGDSVLHVSDPKTAHIESLVRKQKNPSSRVASSKQNRKNRFAKGYQGGKFGTENRNGPYRGFNNGGGSYQRPENFSKNTRMEYTQSKWYQDRTKDSWRQKKIESRAVSRYNNFNAGRTTLPNSGIDSSPQNGHTEGGQKMVTGDSLDFKTRGSSQHSSFHSPDDSWSGGMTSMEEHAFNFRPKEESRYAEESRSWRVQLRVADNKQNLMVGTSQCAEFGYQQYQSNSFSTHQFGGGPTNNYNNGWWDWSPNNYPGPAPRDNQSGKWWPGLQGSANSLLPWMGSPLVPQINPPQMYPPRMHPPQMYPRMHPPPPCHWNNGYFYDYPIY